MYGGQTSAYSTAATVNTVLPKVQRLAPINSQGLIYDYGMGEGDYPQTPVYGAYNCGGTIDFNVVDFDFLKHWIGPKTGSGTAGSPYILTQSSVVALNTSSIQPFTLEVQNTTEATDTVDTYIGCVGNNFTLSADLGRTLRCTAQFIARNPISSTSVTSYTPVTTPAFIMINGSVKWGGSPSAISGVQKFAITHTNGLVGNQNDIVDRFNQLPYVGQKMYTFTFSIKMAQAIATTIVDHFYGKTNQPEDGATAVTPTAGVELKIEIVNASRNGIIWLDDCYIDDLVKINSVGDGLVILDVVGHALSGKGSVPLTWWS